MVCDCQDKRWVEWVRVQVENKAICSVCRRDIPIDEIQTKEHDKSLTSLDSKGVKAFSNGKTP